MFQRNGRASPAPSCRGMNIINRLIKLIQHMTTPLATMYVYLQYPVKLVYYINSCIAYGTITINYLIMIEFKVQ